MIYYNKISTKSLSLLIFGVWLMIVSTFLNFKNFNAFSATKLSLSFMTGYNGIYWMEYTKEYIIVFGLETFQNVNLII